MTPMLVTKLHSTNLTMELTALAVDLIGQQALVMPSDEEAQGYTIPKLTPGAWLSQSMFTIATSIAGGASNIQRNIGERLLTRQKASRGSPGRLARPCDLGHRLFALYSAFEPRGLRGAAAGADSAK
jgi:hypothetical protein